MAILSKGHAARPGRVLRFEDERRRGVITHECVEQLARYFRSHPGLMDLPTGWEHLNHGDPLAWPKTHKLKRGFGAFRVG